MPSVNSQLSGPASDLPRPRSAPVIATNAYAARHESRSPAQRPLEEDRDDAYCVAFTPDGPLLAAAYENGTIAVWELATGGHEFWRVHAGFVNDVVFSPSEWLLASAGKDGTVRLWR